jgi:group II intron reverse transcriptase/maturase
MQDAETVLTAIRNQGIQHQSLERVYRQMFNRDLYVLAYGKIYRNSGATTPGVTGETVDGMSLTKIDAIIAMMRRETYRWTPVRRAYIEKKNSITKRPLGIPTWSDKLVQEVIRLILDAYYEPQFSNRSHGFRPQRSCQTALHSIMTGWMGTAWFIEGDITGCFDNLDHEVMLGILAEHIHDGRFLGLIRNCLQAGHLENWTWRPSLSGSPQGGIVSPILANIYLDRLDQFVEQTLLPQYTRGKTRQRTAEYEQARTLKKYHRKVGNWDRVKALQEVQRSLPVYDTHDEGFRRLRYVRYADDFLLGFAGPRCEAEEIKRQLATFLSDTLKLELSDNKTVITHARTDAARFLGHDICTFHADEKVTNRQRAINGNIGLKVPYAIVNEKCKGYMRNGKPAHRKERENETDYGIVALYQAEYRGFAQFYELAYNRSVVLGRLRLVMETSMLKTLAGKHKTSVAKVARRYGTTIQTKDGPRKVIQVRIERDGKEPLVATWGAVSLKRRHTPRTHDVDSMWMRWVPRTELTARLLADTCEMCGSQENVEVHHIRHLKTVNPRGRVEKPLWMQIMASRQRKTLVVCSQCHDEIHRGRTLRIRTGEPDDAKVSRPVRRGADGNVR